MHLCSAYIAGEELFHVESAVLDLYGAFGTPFSFVVFCQKGKRNRQLQGDKCSGPRKNIPVPLASVRGTFGASAGAGSRAYEEGDDAFYVAISTITENADTMYRKLPYTGGTTGLDARHGLAPFPIWVSFLAKASGIPSVTMAHVVLPMILIIMSYGIYYLLGRHLLGSHKAGLPLFMILVELLILFGGYSVYSAENFLLVRTAQGKAVLANIIIPFLMLLMVLLLEKQEKQERAGVGYWFLLALAMTAGCLCSTLGTLLTCILVGVTGLCAAVCYRRWRVLVPTALCCMIPVLLALLYFVLD